jgi:SAM-dependent methyltransferase
MRALPPLPDPLLEETRQSWNIATAAHNAHKAGQGEWLRTHSTLFPEEVGLLGDIRGRDLLHLCCNSGQDTISLALHHGARCTGVDMSDVAVEAARALSATAGAGLTVHQDEVIHFLEETDQRYDVVYGSYGFLPWIHDLPRLFLGALRVLRPGGRLVALEFHPMAWSFDPDFRLRDPYFAPGHLFSEPVSDYVGAAGGALSPSGHVEGAAAYDNPHRAHAAQQPVGDIVTALLEAGFTLEALREWPYANGCRLNPSLVAEGEDGWAARRFVPPPGVPSIPLMVGLSARASGGGRG